MTWQAEKGDKRELNSLNATHALGKLIDSLHSSHFAQRIKLTQFISPKKKAYALAHFLHPSH
jgi:hypothetical protein